MWEFVLSFLNQYCTIVAPRIVECLDYALYYLSLVAQRPIRQLASGSGWYTCITFKLWINLKKRHRENLKLVKNMSPNSGPNLNLLTKAHEAK